MDIGLNFFKSIYNDDIIYHYTKASTAIDFILYNNQLKFNKTRKSSDPIESSKVKIGTVYFGPEVSRIKTLQHNQNVNELHGFVSNLSEQFYQICFCQNSMGSDFASEDYISTFQGNEELFGFKKLRMWDQYADKFSGVCIAFSKEKLSSLNNKQFELIMGDVKYLNFQELLTKKVGDIQGNYLLNVGKRKYKKQLEQIIKDSFFYKHIDYIGETEYRIGTLFDKTKCSFEEIRGEMLFNRTMMLDISGCVKAIFVSSFANKNQKEDLLKYAHTLNVEMIELEWHHNSFTPHDYKGWNELIKKI